MHRSLNPLPDDKILDWSKLKAFADDKINVAENLDFVLGRIENIVGKGENAGYQQFIFIRHICVTDRHSMILDVKMV